MTIKIDDRNECFQVISEISLEAWCELANGFYQAYQQYLTDEDQTYLLTKSQQARWLPGPRRERRQRRGRRGMRARPGNDLRCCYRRTDKTQKRQDKRASVGVWLLIVIQEKRREEESRKERKEINLLLNMTLGHRNAPSFQLPSFHLSIFDHGLCIFRCYCAFCSNGTL